MQACRRAGMQACRHRYISMVRMYKHKYRHAGASVLDGLRRWAVGPSQRLRWGLLKTVDGRRGGGYMGVQSHQSPVTSHGLTQSQCTPVTV